MADVVILYVLHSVCMELEEYQELTSQQMTAAEPCNHNSMTITLCSAYKNNSCEKRIVDFFKFEFLTS